MTIWDLNKNCMIIENYAKKTIDRKNIIIIDIIAEHVLLFLFLYNFIIKLVMVY